MTKTYYVVRWYPSQDPDESEPLNTSEKWFDTWVGASGYAHGGTLIGIFEVTVPVPFGV